MDSSPTLHDFVLNLLCDATARSAFELDPEGALEAAGLGDITAADVQEVIPLVVDYAPVQGIPALVPTDQLTTGLTEVDVAGAVRHLQAVTQQLAVAVPQPAADVNAAAASAVTVGGADLLTDLPVTGLGLDGLGLDGLGLGGLPSLPGVPTSPVGVGTDTGLWVDSDPAAGVDADLVTPVGATVGGTVTGAVSGTDQIVGDVALGGTFGTLDVAVNAVTGVAPDGLLDPLADDAAILPSTSSVVGSVVRPDGALGGVTDGAVDVDGTLHGVGNTVTGVGGLVGLGNSGPADARHDGDGLIDLF
jgi:hypothetical protein